MFLVIILVSSCGTSNDTDMQVDNSTSTNGEESVSEDSIEMNEDTNESSDSSSTEEVIVTFECSNLETLVRTALNIETGDILSTDMLNLYDIRPNGNNVESLVGLEYAKNLENFGILNNEIELHSLEPISQLTSLRRITVSYTDITEPVTLGKLNQVNTINFIDTNISDISFLSGFTALENLTLLDSGIENIDGIAGLNNLIKVQLRGNNITSIEALEGMDQIKDLNLQGNNVSNLEPLASLIGLEVLNLSYNPVTNLKPLEDLPNLTELTIYLDHDVKHKIFDQVEKLEENGMIVNYHR